MPLEQAFVAASKGHYDLKAFDYGKLTMNAFLAKFVDKHGKLGLSRTYVLPEITETGKAPIAAYFTLRQWRAPLDFLQRESASQGGPVFGVWLTRQSDGVLSEQQK